MKLQNLEMFGFKSFADRVDVEFNPGITAIVGPNGCGKSNISDAVRWVLGEQRPTLVRGSKMEEVIFNGTRERSPINLAEVTLEFSNEDGLLPVDYSEVSITRRVFREGESEYLMNKQPCRLKDIQDLFLGTGIGTHAYSLIQQGMVDSILSDKTEERRYMFEEAAGVTRYKNRRKAAERKLEATTRDLERVEDIVGEVQKTVNSLKRQVGKTRRYREYVAEEARLDVHVVALERAALDAREAPLAEELAALADAEAEQAARIGELEAEVETLELELVDRREAERETREAAEDLKRQIARREESNLVTGESLKHNRKRLEDLDAEDERAAGRVEELVERRERLDGDLAEAEERLARIVERLETEVGDVDEEARVAELRSERARLADEVESLQERLAEARQASARQASVVEGAAERLDALEVELEERRAEREEAEAEAGRAREALARATTELESAAGDLEAARQAREAAGARLDEAREALASERASERAAASRLETLAALEERFEGYGRGARALLSDEASVDGLAGTLTGSVEPVEPRFEKPLERYLETLGHALLARDRTAARAAADRLADGESGWADLLVPELMADGLRPDLPDEAAAVVIARGADAMRWTGDGAIGGRLVALFERLLVVADREAALRCREALDASPEAARHFVIAGLDGTLIEPTGRWRTAGVEGDEGLLARRRHKAETERTLATLRGEVARHADELESAEAALEATRDELEVAQARAADREEARRAAREALAVAEETAAQAGRRVAELEQQVAEQRSRRERARHAVASLEETAAGLEGDLSRAKERHASLRGALERHEQARIDRQSARHSVELERSEAEADVRAVRREIEHVGSAEAAIDTAREERAGERIRLEEANARLEAEREATAAEIESLYERLDAIEKRLRESAQALREIEERRSAHESELKTLRRAHDETLEKRHERALARQEIGHRRRALDEHLVERYAEADAGPDAGRSQVPDLDALLERHPLTDEEAERPLEELRERLEEVRRKRANIGPVNMLAVEEFEKESERLEFLVSQRDDLVDAKRQLEDAIRTINATARQLFEETFGKVAENFQSTFRTLFEGGHAEVRLEDPDDPLESPIEIVASPRGKRVTHITLLSGGERALTALALLFAIYHVKPSPFCVLDEVDAPLDDANVGRFLHMIRSFSDRTQFVIITHNKRTMEAADYLYGVTMEEPGISTLVSVALEQTPVAGNGERGGNGKNGGNGHPAEAGDDEDVRSLEEVWAAPR